MSESDGQQTEEQQRDLALDDVMVRDEDILIVTELGENTAVVRELGDRRLPNTKMFDLGDDCPNPFCDGAVEEGYEHRRRRCSEGCLEWLPAFPTDGQQCDRYGDRCDGEVVHDESSETRYRYHCTECSTRGGGEKSWREAWYPREKDDVVEMIKEARSEAEA